MSKFVSYAQNFEDVILWRALKDVQEGFYIDVGANDPDVDSVTKAFYEKGWRGINIEPIQEWFVRLEAQRPRDINLPIAGGSASGELIIHELEGTGLSTSDAATAKRHSKERGYKGRARTVPVESLNTLCERYHLAPIHFLKIDVEGAEKAVLEGIDLERIRPWIIVVESTLPNSPVEDFEAWEPLILAARYTFVYFDGLNRYYLAIEHQDLAERFRVPPNVFDDFVTARNVLLESQVLEANEQALKTERWAKDLAEKLEKEIARADDFHQRLVSTETSWSERLASTEASWSERLVSLEDAWSRRVTALEGVRGQLSARNSELEVQLADLHLQLKDRHHELAVIYASLSWKLTIPVRWLGLQLRLLYQYGWRARLGHVRARVLGIPPDSVEVMAPTESQVSHIDLPPLASRLMRRMTENAIRSGREID